MNDPNVPVYRTHINQLSLRLKITDCSLNDALAEAISFMPNQAAAVTMAMNGTQMKPAFWSQTGRSAPSVATICGSPPRPPNTLVTITSGTRNCTTLTPRLPRPALRPSAVPFSDCG